MSSKFRYAAAALALLLLLSAGAAHARPPGVARIPAVSFESLWQLVSGWASLWAKEGSEMDPNGLVTPLPPSDAGGDMDPNGIRKAGGEMDPDGLVTPLPTTDAGSDMDPDG